MKNKSNLGPGGAVPLLSPPVSILLLAVLIAALPAMAQTDQGIIMGYVKDSSDAAIPGVTVTITNIDTNISHQTESDATGFYRSIPLAIGNYSVAAEYSGFKRTVRSGITLEIEQQALVDVVLEVGAVTEEVTVTAAAPLLQTSEASQGEVIDNQKIVDLPLNGRSYLQLALLTKGAGDASLGRWGGFNAGGLRSVHNNFLLDGMDNNSNQMAGQGRTGQAISPSIDAIQEFKVLTNAYSAEYGRNVGGVVNAVIKSGTNDIHGGAFEFLRNEKLDAKNFFDSPTAQKPPYKRNQFGAFVGGPIVRNRTFYFGDYEGTIQRESATTQSTVATPLEKTGDFSQSIYANKEVQIFDPNSYDPVTKTRQAFPGNVIPLSQQDPVAAQVVAFYPEPNQPGPTNNYLSHPLTRRNTHKFNARIDHTFSDNDSIYGRYSNHYFIHKSNGELPEPAFGGTDRSTTYENRNQAFVISHTHIFTPTLFNNLKVGWNRFLTNRKPPTDVDYNAQVGIKGTAAWPGLAVFSISGFRNLGNQASTPHISDSQDRQLVNDLSWIKGRHTVKAGANIHFIQSDHVQAYQSQGVFTFNGNFTRQTKPTGFGHPLADVFTGYPRTSQLTSVARGQQRRRLYAFYANDQFRLTNRLTLNMGVRWEYIGPWFEKFNKFGNFQPYTDPPGLVVAKDGGIFDRSTINADYNNFAPRIGIAFRPDDKTVIRTGYGIYYGGVDHIGDRYLHCGPPYQVFSTFSTDNIHPTIIVRDGFPAGALTENVTNLQTISQSQRNLTPYSQQWNFTVQRELVGNLSLEIAYAATKGNRLLRRMDSNMPDPGPGNVNARRPVSELYIPQWDQTVSPMADTFRREWSSNSNNHSMIFNVKKRFSHGLSFLANYTWSKTFSDYNGHPQNVHDLRAEKGLADQHVPHRFVVSYNYELPFGRGRPFMTDAHAALDAILGGWDIAGIATLSAGQPFTVLPQGDPCNTGNRAPCRADATGISPKLSADERSLDRWFNTEAFVAPPQYTFGNSSNNPPGATTPGTVNFDFAIYKSFQPTERIRIQFRTEMFNATNTPHFGGPGTTVGANNYGVITSAGAPRIIQFGLKLYF